MDQIIIPVILSGGAGARLWPISRESHPKPFILLPDGQSLLQKTFARACQIRHTEIMTITNKEYYFKSLSEYEAAGIAQQPKLSFLLEPFARNTCGAIALAALQIAHQYDHDAILLVLPADHLITPVPAFVVDCEKAIALASTDQIVTFGIQPTSPETGYGYIECGEALLSQADSRHVKRFVEKPSREVAENYLTSGNYLWNSGMFCFKAGTILNQLRHHAPALLQAAETCFAATQRQSRRSLAIDIDATTFQNIPSISIDYAVMEKSADIVVVDCHLDWQDIGSWEAYKKLFSPDARGNSILGEAILIDSDNNFIHSESRLVTSIGIQNLAIIDTPDALLITQRERVQEVKDIVQTLKSNAHESYMTHRTVIRPWGSYTVLEEGPCFKIKRISVKPGASLSLQKHEKRSEHWVVVDGRAKIVNGDQEYFLETNESTFVPMHTQHRLSNPGTQPLIIIEVQTGSYLGEDDIIRLEDHYGRVAMTEERIA